VVRESCSNLDVGGSQRRQSTVLAMSSASRARLCLTASQSFSCETDSARALGPEASPRWIVVKAASKVLLQYFDIRDRQLALPSGSIAQVVGSQKFVSETVLFLASDESRYTTGVTLPIDAGSCLK
jgi:NAD(P)-dependent dehydrogenase (short-subunit alcohol dehydrogenase family)